MKTYDERLRSIQKKAKTKKTVRFFSKTAGSILCLMLILSAAVLLSQLGPSDPMDNPALNAPPGTDPGIQPQEPTGTTSGAPMFDLPVFTSPTSPGNTQGPPSDAEEPYAYLDFEAAYVKTTQPSTCDDYPAIHLITSVEELADFCASRYREYIAFEGVNEQALNYDEAYFENKSLIILMLEEGSGSVRHNVVNVDMYANNVVNIELERIVPEIGTCDMAYWYIFVDVSCVLPEESYICYQQVNTPIVDELPVEPVNQIATWELEKMREVFVLEFCQGESGISADDVVIERVISVFDRRYALFVDGVFGYLYWIETENVNGYDFVYGSSQKMYLYYDGHYYRLQEAYDAGLLSDEELQKLYDAYRSEYWFHYVDE